MRSLDEAIGEALDLVARKTLDDDRRLGTDFPYVTDPSGTWKTLPASLSAGYTPTGSSPASARTISPATTRIAAS
jgi:hypothetical protein